MSTQSNAVFESMLERDVDPLVFYNQTPRNARLAIYGSGKAGDQVFNFIKTFRNDITVRCFIDSFRSGSKNGIPIVKADQIREIEDIDFIAICSAQYKEIEGTLKFLGEHRYIIIRQDQKYTSRYYSRNKENFDNVIAMLHAESDKNLYKLLLDYSCNYDRMLLQPDVYVNKIKATLKESRWYTDNINTDKVQFAVDAGAYKGDTAKLFIDQFNNLKKVYSFDISFTRDQFYKFIPHFTNDDRIEFYELGLSDKKEVQYIIANPYNFDTVGAHISRDAKNNKQIQCTSLDIFSEEHAIEQIDYIKMDIEGAEYEALIGGRKTITRCRPQLAISIYHEPDDMWSIPLLLKDMCTEYVFRLGQYMPDLKETVLYCIPKELYQGQ